MQHNQRSSTNTICYVNQMESWWGPSIINQSFGLDSQYDIIILQFWLSKQGAYDAVQLYQNIYTNLGTNDYGKSNYEVQQNIQQLFHKKGKRLFISAFGQYDLPTKEYQADKLANNLADWIEKNPFIDGVDISYEDTHAFLQGIGAKWVIEFQKTLRKRLGQKYLITHSPKAEYFQQDLDYNNAYVQVNQEIGQLIDWYNIQFQLSTQSTLQNLEETIFCSKSNLQLIRITLSHFINIIKIPASKLTVGRFYLESLKNNKEYQNKLGSMLKANELFSQIKLKGLAFSQLKDDSKSEIIQNVMQGYQDNQLVQFQMNHPKINNDQNLQDQNMVSCQLNLNQQNLQQINFYAQAINQNTYNSNPNSQIKNNDSTNYFNNNNNNQLFRDQPIQKFQNQYMQNNQKQQNFKEVKQIKTIAYINRITTWYGPKILDCLGLNSNYDILILTFWLSSNTAVDALLLYKDIYTYMGTDQYGKTNQEVQKNFQNLLQNQGKQLFISAFGDSDYPTSKNPKLVAQDLANFANALPYIDGIDIDYEDNQSMENGQAVDWLIQFTKELRKTLRNKEVKLTHSPQAPYFSRIYYKSGGYSTINDQAGSLIDWYNVQFYNQGSNSYDTLEKLFIQSAHVFQETSVKEIVEKGKVPLNKIIIGKPATTSDATNTGYVDPVQLGKIIKQAQKQLNINIAGFFIWQLCNDKDGTYKQKVFQQIY